MRVNLRCCAVICHCEFQDRSHLRVAIRIIEDAEREARSFKFSQNQNQLYWSSMWLDTRNMNLLTHQENSLEDICKAKNKNNKAVQR